mgnify:CR=1 FL=1
MKSIHIAVELIILGLAAIFAAFHVCGIGSSEITNRLGDQTFIIAAFLLTGAYLTGFFLNGLAEFAFQPLQQSSERAWMKGRSNLTLGLDALRHELYATGGAEVCERLEYQLALARIARGVGFTSVLLLILSIGMGKPIEACLFGSLALLGIFAFHRRVIRFAETAVLSWTAIQRHRPESKIAKVFNPPALARLVDGVSVRVLIFAGGTGFRNCNIALARRGHRVTRVVPPWDSGGSSRTLRNEFGVLSIGDLRHALMTMAHGENISNEVIRLFNWRLSEDGEPEQLLKEMNSFLKQEHPLIANVPTDLRNVILKYLETFWSHRPASLDLCNGSIGNLVILGAYLAHGNDMNTAIYVFRQLCGILGNVWPVSLENDLQLCARLEGGKMVASEEQVTAIKRPEITDRIERTFLTRTAESNDNGTSVSVASNPLVINAFGNVDAVVFGPGSFFSSVLPHLMVSGVVDELANTSTPKIFVGNMLEGNECFGWSVVELVEIFLATCHEFASVKRESNQYLTLIIAHDSSNHRRTVLGDRYLTVGDLERFQKDGIKVTIEDLEDPWKRGHHDANVLAQRIIDEAR